MRALLFLTALLVGVAMTRANGPVGDAPPPERPELRGFDEERVGQLRAANDYDSDLRRAPSLWDRFKQWVLAWLERLLGSRAGSFVAENLLYLICFLAIVLTIVVLSRHGLRRVFHGAPRSMGQVMAATEDIREMDLPALIAQAERGGDLRLAIRLHYLLVLRRLVDQGLLTWSPERTDRDYMAQLKDPGLRSRFAHAALIFQWVWYGHAEVDRSRYAEFRRPFVEFEQQPAR